MKTIALQYHETRSQAHRCKPRSNRKIVLTRKLRDLMTRQLKIENRK